MCCYSPEGQADYTGVGWKAPHDIFPVNWSGLAIRLNLTYRNFGLRKTIEHADGWSEGDETNQERSESSEKHAA